MRNHPLRRGLIAVATALTVLAVLASPASAATATIETVDATQVTTFTIGSQTFTIPGDEGADDGCTEELPPQGITVNFPSAGNWTASGSIKGRFKLDPPNDAQLWQADMTLTSASGTYSSPGPTGYTHALASSAPNHIIITATIHPLTEPGCEKGVPVCTLRTRVLLTSGSGIDNPPSSTTGDEAKLNFSSNPGGNVVTLIGGACPATISSAFVGQHASGTLHLNF